MLRAIAIYIKDDAGPNAGKLRKVQSAEQGGLSALSTNSLFSPSESYLKNIDKLVLESDFYRTMRSGLLYKFTPAEGEVDFIYQPTSQKIVIAICSRKRLDPSEKVYLFKNIEHIYRNPNGVQATLNDIINNPLGYTGRDILTGRIKEEFEELKKVMTNNIEIAINMSENIDSLKDKTVDLSDKAVTFNRGAKGLNSYCGCS